MTSDVLVSRPQFHSGGTEERTERDPAADREVLLRCATGESTVGFRCSKYNPAQWHSNNYSTLQRAVRDRDEAQKVHGLSKSLSTDTEAETLHRQSEGTRCLGERLQETHSWRSELQLHIQRVLAETELLLAQKNRLEKALDATEIPYAIATDNLTCRERRLGPDLVQDTVEEELTKEVELIRSIQALLKRTIEQVVCQIRINRETKLALELDWSDKCQAYEFDDQCGRYSNMSRDTQIIPSSATMQDQVSNRTSWMMFTQDNLSKASCEQHATRDLRLLVDRVLQDTAGDLKAQCAAVDQAFSHRCLELNEAKTQLELHLTQILEQVGVQERNIVALQRAIHDKTAPLRVAHSRLFLRSLRPNVELCRDDPQLSLVAEVGQIEASLVSLNQRLSEARGSLSRLEEARMALEKDIACKTHSLLIDRDKCMARRRRYPTVVALTGY